MLANLERAYLGILRVVILIFATIALIVTFVSLFGAAPELLRWSGLSHPEKPSGGTLAAFVAEQKAINTGAAGVAGGTDATPSTAYILPAIKGAVANLSRYPGLTVDSAVLSQKLQHEADSFHERGAEYADSLKALTEELAHSNGQPLSRDRILALLDWHENQFMADVVRIPTKWAGYSDLKWATAPT